eukprot:m.47674 g.47674  ORF g.47674 m.47674 type:complete len:343 (-) comp20552_c0_seq1:43-1071(-)
MMSATRRVVPHLIGSSARRLDRVISHLSISSTVQPDNEVEFPMKADGTLLRGEFFKASSRCSPAIIMAHGFSSTYRMGLVEHAQHLQKAGYSVLVFDHKSYGRSDGVPRTHIDYYSQADGYRDAIDFVSDIEGVNENKIALWGVSFTGGMVLEIGALDSRVKAVLSITPANISASPIPESSQLTKLKSVLIERQYLESPTKLFGPLAVIPDDSGRDFWFGGAALGYIGDQCDVKTAAANTHRFFTEKAEHAQWVNDTTMVMRKKAKPSPHVALHFLTKPVLMVAAVDDEVVNFEHCKSAFALIPSSSKTFVQVSGGHFSKQAKDFNTVLSQELRFLTNVFGN